MTRLIVICMLVTFTLGIKVAVSETHTNTKSILNVLLDWKPTPSFIGFYVSEELGLYKKRGLKINFQHGTGAADAVKLVGTGKYDLGTASAQTLLFGIEAKIPVKSLAILYPRSSTVLITLVKNNILHINDLRGKTIGVNRVSATYHDFKWIMKKFDLVEAVDYKEIDVGWENTPLLLGDVDAILDYSEQIPIVLKSKGIPINTIRLSDNGLDVYGFNIIGNEMAINNRSTEVRDFVEATIEGYRLVREKPEYALDVFLRRFPENDQNIARNAISEVVYNLGESIIGCQKSEGWKRTWQALNETDAIEVNKIKNLNNTFVRMEQFCK